MGGCEDPRMTRIDDRVYMTYVAYDGYSQPRVALSSIHIDDFSISPVELEETCSYFSPLYRRQKCLYFAGKINGKYVIFHRVFPDILIDLVDNLDFMVKPGL